MIVVEDLFYQYPRTKKHTLENVTFRVERGELVLVTGHSGSGKSTLLYCLKGLVPQLYGGKLDGRVEVGGEGLSQLSVADIAQRVGLVMQDPDAQFCNLFVRDEISFGVENLKLDPAVCLDHVQRALEAVNLTHMADKQVIELSGGEKQRVAIASVLAMDVPVLLLDEPAANLDAKSGREVLRFVSSLRDSGKTILLVQHELDEMIHAADKLLIMENGTVVDFGPPRTLIEKYDQHLTTKHNIGLPQIANAALRTRQWFHFERIPLSVEEFAAQVNGPPNHKPVSLPDNAVEDNSQGQLVVDAEGVSYTYPRFEQPAVRDVSLEVSTGEVVAIVGKNGSGKSTLARLLVGLLKPETGVVRLGGTSVTKLERHRIHAMTGYVFQYPEHQFLADSVRNEIAYGLEVQGKSEQEIEQIVADAIASLKLSGMEARHPFTLSGGEKRRLSVATMLVLRPRLLILDEPTYGLDEGNLINLVRFLFEQLRARGITILFITHDMRLVAEHAERAVVMHEGRLVFDGKPVELFKDADLLERAELLAPPIVELTNALAERGFSLPAHTVTLDQFSQSIEAIFT